MRSIHRRALAVLAVLVLSAATAFGASTASVAAPATPNAVSVTHTNPSTSSTTLEFSAERTGNACNVIDSYGRATYYPTSLGWEYGSPNAVAVDLVTQSSTTFSYPAPSAGNSLRILVVISLDCDGEQRFDDVSFDAPPPPSPAIDLTVDGETPSATDPIAILLTATHWDDYECVVFPPNVTWTSTFVPTSGPTVTDEGSLSDPEFDGSTQRFRFSADAVGAPGTYTFSVAAADACLYELVLNDTLVITIGGSSPSPSPEPTDTERDLEVELELELGGQVEGASSTATASGLQDGAGFDIVVRSTPQTLAVGTVPTGGVVTRTVTLPTLPAGWHSITFTSTWAGGGTAVGRVWFQVSATGTLLATSATAPRLAATGDEENRTLLLLGTVAITAGLALVGWRRRPELLETAPRIR